MLNILAKNTSALLIKQKCCFWSFCFLKKYNNKSDGRKKKKGENAFVASLVKVTYACYDNDFVMKGIIYSFEKILSKQLGSL